MIFYASDLAMLVYGPLLKREECVGLPFMSELFTNHGA